MSVLIPAGPDPIETLARAVLDDLDGAAALADLADELDRPTAPYMSGRPSPSRGTLLRRRIKRWQNERDFENTLARRYKRARVLNPLLPARDALFAAKSLEAAGRVDADRRFRDYIRDKFIPKILRV